MRSKPLLFNLLASRLNAMNYATSLLLMAAFAASAAKLDAASLALTRSTRAVTLEEIAGGAPAGYVHDFFFTSDSDLLSFSQVNVDVPIFQDAFGRDSAASDPLFASLSAGVTADSFITTPGTTLVLGGGFGGEDGLWGDLSNDGPQQDFHFARLTVSQTGSFSGAVALSTNAGPISLPFSFALPGTEIDLAALHPTQSVSIEYSLDPPPQVSPPIPDPIVIAPVPTVPEVPPSMTPPAFDPPIVELTPAPDLPPVVDPPATPTETEVVEIELSVPVQFPFWDLRQRLIDISINGSIADIDSNIDLRPGLIPTQVGRIADWRSLVDVTHFDGLLSRSDLSTRLFANLVLFTTGIESSITLNGMDHDGALLAHAASGSQIPEPATAPLTAFALLALAAARRR